MGDNSVHTMLMVESKKLEKLAAENESHINRMINPKANFSSSSVPFDQPHYSSTSHSPHIQRQQSTYKTESRYESNNNLNKERTHNNSLSHLHINDLRTAQNSAHTIDRNINNDYIHSNTRSKQFNSSITAPRQYNAHNKSQKPLLFDTTPSSVPFRLLAKKCVPLEVQAEFRVNSFLRIFVPHADLVLVGVHLTLLYSYYASNINTGLFPDDLVRLCRAAGLMDGQHTFSIPDIFAVVRKVLTESEEENYRAIDHMKSVHIPIQNIKDVALDFALFGTALSEIAAFRFSKTPSMSTRHQRLYRRFLAPLTYRLMISDLTPQSSIVIIKHLKERIINLEDTSNARPKQMRQIIQQQEPKTTDPNTKNYEKERNHHDHTTTEIPGVVRGSHGELDPLIGLPEDFLVQSRQRAEVQCVL